MYSRVAPNASLFLPVYMLLLFLSSCATPPDAAQRSPLPTVSAQATLPSGFSDTLLFSVAKPTALAFTPDSRALLITTQPGRLYVRQNGRQRLAYTVRNLCSDSERGLLGVAADPNFAQNRAIYLYYTFNKSGSCAKNSSSSPVNRVARFRLASDNTVLAGSQAVLIDNIPSPNGNHNGGDLRFGKDGLLYVSVGDGGCDYEGNSGCGAANDAARGRHTLVGKILRVTRDGGVPAGNPFTGSNSVRCNVTGRTTAGKSCREVFALGLRNPFRIATDPNVSGTRLFINDVGQSAREEIDQGKSGANYGWNLREGSCATGGGDCGAPPAGLTNPVFDYAHSSSGTFAGCRSISGGAFVPNGFWPASFNNSYLFSDFICGKIFKLTPSGSGGYTASTFASNLGPGSAVHMTFGAFNGGRALFYTTYADGGQLRRISYSGR